MGDLNQEYRSGRAKAMLLSMPAELRLQIYKLLFPPPVYQARQIHQPVPTPSLTDFGNPAVYGEQTPAPEQQAAIVAACRMLYQETQNLYLGNTFFHLVGPVVDPAIFAERTAHLSSQHKEAIRHIVLTARVSCLRALNETWNSLPFGDNEMFLDTLTVVPYRPETQAQVYAEIADLSQCHTLAYILTETLKGLRNVDTVIVRNEGCFKSVIWKQSYRSLVFRLWKWCGRLCDLRFKEDEDEQAFSIRCIPGKSRCDRDIRPSKSSEEGWNDLLQERNKLFGVEMS